MATSDVSRGPRLGVPRGLRRERPPVGAPAARALTTPIELSAALAVARWMLVALSGLSLWLVAYALVFSGVQEHRAQHALFAQFREKLAGPQGARIGIDQKGRPIPIGEPVVLLNSAAAHLTNVVVVEGTASKELRDGPGHLRYTPLPGQAGASTIFGRSVTFGAPFARIADLKSGDTISAVTGQGRFRYEVRDVRRAGDPLPPPLPAGGSQLTLVTSEGNGWRTGWAPTRTVYVDAVLVSPKTAAAVGGHVAAVTDQENAMRADTSGLVPTIFWLQGLFLAALAIVWAWRRWGVWQTWIAGFAVVLALLWGATSSAAVLLPNLM